MSVPAPRTVERHVSALVDICKLTRSQWMSRAEMSRHTGIRVDTIICWVREMVVQGVLLERMGTQPEGVGGPRPMVYALAPQWGGQVAQQAEVATA